MNIDEHLPRLLELRGLSRRRAAAALRTVAENSELSEEASHILQLATASLDSIDGYNRHSPRFTIPVGKDVTWMLNLDTDMSNVVIIDREIPATAAVALRGGPLSRLVDDPLLPVDRTVVKVEVVNGKTIAHLLKRNASIADVMPARKIDLEIEKRAWRRERAREARTAGATVGVTIREAWISAASATAVFLATLLVCAALGLLSASPASVIGAAAVVSIAGAAMGAVMRSRREDPGLEDRIWTARSRRIGARRVAIMAGKPDLEMGGARK